jgi:hypothetical protein
MQNLPLVRIKRCCCQNGRRNRQAVRCKIFEQAQRQRKSGNGPRGCRAKNLIDARPLIANGLKRLGNDRACAVRSGARNKIDQLAPANRRIVAVFGRLVEDGHQSIVEAHWLLVSFGRTLLSLYATIYNALRRNDLTAP